MPGFPGAAIGAGLGLGAEQIQKQRQQELVAQQMQAYLQNMQRQQKLEAEKDQASAALFGAISTGGLDGGGQQPQSLGLPGSQYVQPPAGSGMKSGLSNPRGLVPYIQQAATARGIDPKTSRSRSRNRKASAPSLGDHGKSGGAFQLYTGGGVAATTSMREQGAEPSLIRRTRKLPSTTPWTRRSKSGWGPWNGAKRVGITGMAGIGGAPTGQMAPGGAATAGSRNARRRGGAAWAPGAWRNMFALATREAPVTIEGVTYPTVSAWNRAMDARAESAGAYNGWALRNRQQRAATIDPKALIQSAPPEMQQASQQAAQAAAGGIPQQLFGRMSLQSLAQAIDKANPNLPASVKGMALIQAMPLLARDQGPELQLMMHMLTRQEHLQDQAHQDTRDDN